MKSFLFSFLFFLSFLAFQPQALAQTNDSFGDMGKAMEQMQQQMMQFFGGGDSLSLKGLFGDNTLDFSGDTSFFFKADTMFMGEDGFDGLLKMMPFGLNEEGDMDMNDIFKSLGGMMELLSNPGEGNGFWVNPQGEGAGENLDEDSDGLLPEERLRLEEQKGDTKKTAPNKKRKTIKI